jgi:hypothetical protein
MHSDSCTSSVLTAVVVALLPHFMYSVTNTSFHATLVLACVSCNCVAPRAHVLFCHNRARLRSGGGAAAAAVLQQHLRPAETPATAAAATASSSAGPNSADDSKGGGLPWTKVRGAADRSFSFDRQHHNQQAGASPKGDDKKWSVVRR